MMEEIGAAAKLAYGRLLQYAGEKGYCWPSYNSLAAELGMSRSTAIRAIAELVAQKLIEIETRKSGNGDNSSNIFYFLAHPALNSDRLDTVERGSVNLTPPSFKSLLPGSVNVTPKKTHSRKRIKEAAVGAADAADISLPTQESLLLPSEVEAAILELPVCLQRDARQIARGEARPPSITASNILLISRRKDPTGALLRQAIRQDYAATMRDQEAAESEKRARASERRRRDAEASEARRQAEETRNEQRRRDAHAALCGLPADIRQMLQAEARRRVGGDLGPVLEWAEIEAVEKYLSMHEAGALDTKMPNCEFQFS